MTKSKVDRAFRAIADPTRRLMLDAMCNQDQSVTDLTKLTGISQPAVSQHLRILRDSELVSAYQEGRMRFYRSNAVNLVAIDDWLAKYRVFWASKLDNLEKQLTCRSSSTKKRFSHEKN